MITPRRTRLIRVPDLHAFRVAIGSLTADPEIPARDVAIVVPTRSAAQQLERRGVRGVPVTRDELYERLHSRLAGAPRRLAAIERDVLAQAAARVAASAAADLAFQIRPGLVGEMLRFYDQLRRQSQQVTRFEELILDALGPEGDIGADRLRRQTRFLADTFREYERRVREVDVLDEHLLRDRLIAEAASDPIRQVVVTVADWIADADGLCVADFDLLARVPGLAMIDVVATERVLASGFEERLNEWMPGIEKHGGHGGNGGRGGHGGDGGREGQEGQVGQKVGRSVQRPNIVTPPNVDGDQLWWTHRDREEELVAIARRVAAARASGDDSPLERVAVVFKRPLPYLYVAPRIFGDAGLAYQTAAALPLAAEPTVAALDLVLEAAASKFTRGSIVALLRSPHLFFASPDGQPVTRAAVSALDRGLSEARYFGDAESLAALADDWSDEAARPALHAAVAIARELAPLGDAQPASQQIRVLLAFWSAHLRALEESTSDPELGRLAARERRARATVEGTLSALAAAHAAEDDPAWTIEDVLIAVRRAIEDQTFALESDGQGIHLIDDQAVRYGEFDEVAIVGLVEGEWPEAPRRNIFYPSGLLKALGWPPEKDRRAADEARFLDLLECAARTTTVSTFTLEDDALVTRSVQLDDMPRARLSSVAFMAETPASDPAETATLDGDAHLWLDLRAGRSSAMDPEFHGTVHAQTRTGPISVSALETYLECPFKFFAQRVLRLEEEPDDEEVMDPRRQGQFMHEVFERFFTAWQEAGHRAITADNLDTARDLFTAVVDQSLEQLPSAEAGLERTRLLGSAAAAGLGEAVLRMEAERPVPVVGRLLEHDLRGDFTFQTADGPRSISLAGKVDRLDLLDDGTFRLIDYKLGWPPDRRRALQLPIYALCAEQRLGEHRGRPWRLGEAVYLAFKGPRRVVPLFANDRDGTLADAQQRMVDAVDAIARGEFPPRPDDVYRCETCRFAAVCRKDYVGDV